MGIHEKFTKRAEIGRPSPRCTVHVCTYVHTVGEYHSGVLGSVVGDD